MALAWSLLLAFIPGSGAAAEEAASESPGFDLGFDLGLPAMGTGGGWLGDLDLDLDLDQGFALSVFSSDGNTAQQGVLLNSIRYNIREDLRLRLNLDVAHTNLGPSLSQTDVLPSLSLDYRPSEKLRLHLDLGQNSAPSRSSRPWSRNNFLWDMTSDPLGDDPPRDR